MSKATVHSTKEYETFKCFESNREVNKSHLKKLVNSIKAKNLLHLFPIVCNDKMDIVDGQHRLRAAIELDVPIYYQVDDDVTKADIAMVNNNRKSWSARDYIHFYKTEGIEAYRKIDELLRAYPKLSIMAAVKLMRPDTREYWNTGKGIGGGSDSEKLKSGKIPCEHFTQAVDACEVATSILKKVNYIFRPDLIIKIKKVMLENEIDKKVGADRLKAKAHLFPKNSNFYDVTSSRLILQILTEK